MLVSLLGAGRPEVFLDPASDPSALLRPTSVEWREACERVEASDSALEVRLEATLLGAFSGLVVRLLVVSSRVVLGR